MANVVNRQILLNGPRHAIVAIYLQSDGATGELVDEPIITLEDLGLELPDKMRLQLVDYNFAGFDAVIGFSTGLTSQNWKWVLAEGSNHPMDFAPFGNIIDDGGLDRDGSLLLSTTGFTSSQDQGSLLIQVRKPRDASA